MDYNARLNPPNTTLWTLQDVDNTPSTRLSPPRCDEMLPDPASPAILSYTFEPRPNVDPAFAAAYDQSVPTAPAARELVHRPEQSSQVEEPQQPATFTLAFRGKTSGKSRGKFLST